MGEPGGPFEAVSPMSCSRTSGRLRESSSMVFKIAILISSAKQVVHGFSLSPPSFLPSPYTTPSPFDGSVRIEGILLHPNPLGVLERRNRERVETLASVKRGIRWRVTRSGGARARARMGLARGEGDDRSRVSKRTATRMRPRTARHLAQQVGQELDHLGAPNRAGKQLKVKMPPGHARHRRHVFQLK